jgi:hypothetical protein
LPLRREPADQGAKEALNPGATTLLHSGIVYPTERNPTPLFEALARLKDKGVVRPGALKLRFRAAVHDELLHVLAARHRLEAWIEICPPIDYQSALQEMLRADGLLVMQGADCNEQIPAKIYEYLRAGRPILCLADPAGDTAGVLRQAGLDDTVPLESADEIETLIPRFIDSIRRGSARTADVAAVHSASRRGRADRLAKIMDATGSRRDAD